MLNFMPIVYLFSTSSFACREIFHDFYVIYGLFFSKLTFSKNSFRNRVSNSFDPDQVRQNFVGPDLGHNCLQRSASDDKIWHAKSK